MEKNYVAPAVNHTAFHCPHCGTKAPQKWLNCYGKEVGEENNLPSIWGIESTEKFIEKVENKPEERNILGDEIFEKWRQTAKANAAGDFSFSRLSDSVYCHYGFGNIFFSVCQEKSCQKAALWIHDELIIPAAHIEESPNEDMPDHIKVIYNEARAVHPISSRASAALLRLCCELLCMHLKANGDNFNKQIADLVGKGMDDRIQKALDIVRFIGNDSIHPGQIDLNENKDTSHTLFVLVNEIVQEMISKPKRLANLYQERLPETIRNAITERDAKAKIKN